MEETTKQIIIPKVKFVKDGIRINKEGILWRIKE